MGKYKFLVKGGNSLNDVTEEFDFWLRPKIDFNDYSFNTRFYLYSKKGDRIGNLFIVCSYQRPGTVNELVNFEAPYKIIEQLSSCFATIMNENLYYKLCDFLPKGEDRKEFAKSLNIMSFFNSSWEVRESDCYQKGCLRNNSGKVIPNEKTPKDLLFNKLFINSRNFYDFIHTNIRISLDDGKTIDFTCGYNRIFWIDDYIKVNKTKAMYEIALALYNHVSDITNDKNQISPSDLDINKIIFVSYKSNLDDYNVPKLPKELNSETTNNYCYVGLQKRFDLGDYDDEFDGSFFSINKIDVRKVDSIANDIKNSYISDKISDWTFIRMLYSEIYNDKSLGEKLEQINVHVGDSACQYLKNFGEKDFLGLDTKHKLFIHMLGMIGRNIQPYSVILIDRPDMFFEPKQIHFLLNTLEEMCEKMKSIVIVNMKNE